MNLEDSVRKLRALKDEKDATEEKLKGINKEIDRVASLDLPALMEAQGIDTFRVAGVGSVTLATDTYVSVLADDRPVLYDWLKETGNDSLITESVHHQTLTSFVKEKLEAGDDIPDVVKVAFKRVAKLRRS